MLAQAEARRLGHNFVGTEQFLLGLIGEKNSAASKVLQSKGVTLKEARIKVEDIISRGKGFVPVEMPFTPRAKRVLELACEQAIELGHDFVAPEHLLLGILAANEGVAIRVLELFGIDLRGLRTTTISVLKGERKL
jgi:ATP-dependent Clp protease ATP-binding subunit ClpC